MIFTAYSKDLALIKILLIYSYFLLKFRHFSLIRLKLTLLLNKVQIMQDLFTQVINISDILQYLQMCDF